MATAELANVQRWYDTRGRSDPLVALHPGGAGVDSHALAVHDDLGTIACRTLVMVADDDEVRLEHAVDLYRSLPDAELSAVPGTSHGLLVDPLPDDLRQALEAINSPSRITTDHRS